MAVWQFEVSLEPESPWTGAKGGDSTTAGGRAARQDDAEILRRIDEILPRRESWSEDMILWGDEDGNRIHAALDGGRIAELTARIDLRQPPGTFPARLVNLARSIGASFSTADGRRFSPDLRLLSEAVRRSDASRFVIDPQRYYLEMAGHPVG